MDVSLEYVKMCEKAFKDLGWIEPDGVVSNIYMTPIGLISNPIFSVKYMRKTHKVKFPIYRQDQLQEMVLPKFYGLISMMEQFYHWAIGELERSGFPKTSMEQLWLAFAMKENCNKIWDGTEWLREGVG